MRDGLGDEYVDQLFSAYRGNVPAEADLVCYWVGKAARLTITKTLAQAGLVTTNSIRGGANRAVLDELSKRCAIFNAWGDEPWVVEGAAVRVSLVCFSGLAHQDLVQLEGKPVNRIHSDLTGGAVDLTTAATLKENFGTAFMGDTKGGPFDIPGEQARQWLQLPVNPNGRPNSDVLRPWLNGQDVTRRSADKWIIDFGWDLSEADAALYERPFTYAESIVLPKRENNQQEKYRKFWWRHVRPRPEMWAQLSGLDRYIATPTVAKHRLFVWLVPQICPDHQLIVIARADDATFGILHSRFHELWSLRKGTSLEDRPRYTPTSTFETFPFPEGLTPDVPASECAESNRTASIATAAQRLNELRQAWLNPADLVRHESEVVPGYPDRLVAVNKEATKILKARTLTNLYNDRPAWLNNAHRELDETVAAAYGWPSDLDDEEILGRLLKLNAERGAIGG